MWAADRNHPVYDKHTFCVPFHYKEYLHIIVTRDPIERFISLYKHYYRWREMITFESYIKTKKDWFYEWTIKDYIQSVQMPKHYCFARIETFNDQFGVDIPKLHQSALDLAVEKDLIPQSWIENEHS